MTNFFFSLLVADLNFGVILAHRAERRERRRLVLSQEARETQRCSLPTARLATPEVGAWQLPRWQAKLHPWPTRLLEATQDIPAEVMKMQTPPTYSGPYRIADVQELNAVCDERSIALSCETDAHKQDGGDSSCSLKDEDLSNEWLILENGQHPVPSEECAPSSYTTEETGKQTEISVSHFVQDSSKVVAETFSRRGWQAYQPSESGRHPSPPFLEGEPSGKPDSHALPSIPTAVEESSKQCSNTEQLLDDFDTRKESPLLVSEPNDDDGSKLGNIPHFATQSLDISVPSSTATNHEQNARYGINPLWQCAVGGDLENSLNITVAEDDADTNELNILSTADGPVEVCSSASVVRPSSVSDCSSADAEPLYEACVAQLTSEVMLW